MSAELKKLSKEQLVEIAASAQQAGLLTPKTLRFRKDLIIRTQVKPRERIFLTCSGCKQQWFIRKLQYIVSHYYVDEPYTPYWSESEGGFICPGCGVRNRMYYRSEQEADALEIGIVKERDGTPRTDFNGRPMRDGKVSWRVRKLFGSIVEEYPNDYQYAQYTKITRILPLEEVKQRTEKNDWSWANKPL